MWDSVRLLYVYAQPDEKQKPREVSLLSCNMHESKAIIFAFGQLP